MAAGTGWKVDPGGRPIVLRRALAGSIIKADNLDSAVELAKGCPVFAGGASVVVAETFAFM